MAKFISKFVCQECGGESLKWLGRCPHCQTWNSLVEEIEESSPKPNRYAYSKKENDADKIPVALDKVATPAQERFETGIEEFDRVLGGGIVIGSIVLIGGEPGIGKSTLLLQCASSVSQKHGGILYVSAEESASQIKIRADRLGIKSSVLYLYAETNLDQICAQIHKLHPPVVIIDSIQTVYRPELSSAPGSVAQVRECAAQLMYLAKSDDIAIFLVGHVTKDGSIAGPRVLEHIVDTVLYLEGERFQKYRILRAVKNRFGSTHELGIFEMHEEGMLQVNNPSEILLSERPEHASGSIVVPSVEGTRPLLIEVQALVTPGSGFGAPRRMTTGVDSRRVSLLIAVLEKRVGMHLSTADVFVNIAGGVRIEEPAIDLGIILALASSFRNKPVDQRTIAIGEVGLSGEVRSVNWIEKRLAEAQKLGFSKAIIAHSNQDNKFNKNGFQIHGVKSVNQALELAEIT